MSAASTPPHHERYVDFDEYVEFQLDKTRKSIKSNDLLTAAAVAAVMALAFLLTFVVLDHWVVTEGFSVAARWCWFVSFIGAVSCWLIWKVVYPSLRRVNRLFAARELEQASPALRSNLLNWVDLRDAGRTVHPAVMQTIEKQAATQLSKMDVGQAIDHRALLKASYALLAVVMLFCGYALFSPKKISTALWRIFPFSPAAAVTRTEIREVTPGDATLLLRGRLEVGVVLGGDIPNEVQMLYTTVDGRVQDESVLLRPESNGSAHFRGVFAGENGNGVLQDFSYTIVAGDAKSARFRVTVHQPPSATVQQVDLHFPEYMKLEDAASPGGNIDGWEGAEAAISATADKPARSAVLQFLDDAQSPPTGEEVPVTVTDGTQLRAAWKLDFRTDGTFPKHYRIQCRNEVGEVDPSPAVYNIVIRPDRPPEVALLHPERDLEAPANAVIPLLVQASDPDFELGYINLQAEKGGQSIHRAPLSEGRQPRITVKHDFELSSLNLKPGDELEFWVEAFDNRQPRRNRKNTPRLKIKIQDPVSKQQAEQQLAADQEQRDQRLAEAQQEQNRQEDAQANAGDRNEEPTGNGREPNEKDESARADEANEPGSSTQKNADSPAENGRDKSQDGRQKAQPKTSGSGESSDPATESAQENTGDSPLSPDGDDDEEALRRLNEHVNQDREQREETADNEKQEQGRQPPQTKTNSADAEEDQSQSEGAGQQKSSTKKQQAGNAPNSDPPQPMPNDDAEPSEKPDQGGKSEKQSQPKNSGGKKGGGDAAKTNPAGQPQPGDASDDAQKPDPTGKAEAKNSPQKDGQGRSDQEKPEQKSGATGDADSQQNPDAEQNPQENTDPGRQPQNSSVKPEQKQTGGNKQQKPNPSKTATGKSGPNNDPSGNDADSSNAGDDNSSAKAQESPGKSGKNRPAKSSPGGKNSDPKPSADKSNAGSDSSERSDPSEGDDKGGDEATGDKPAGDKAAKQPAPAQDGKQSPGKSKANSKDKNSGEPGEKDQNGANQDPGAPKTERQSDDSENRRPGAGSDADAESAPEKSKSPSPRKNPGAKKTDLENDRDAEPSEKPQPSAKQKIEGEPAAADEELKGPGRKEGQRSEQPDGGEGGGSKQDKEGNPGSKTKGPGEKSSTPGKESVADEKTGQSDPQERPGEGSQTKPGTKEGKSDRKQAAEQGDKPGADKSGGKSGDPTDAQSGSEAGDGDQPGSEGEGKAVEGKAPGKGTGKKPSDKTGSGSPQAGSQPGSKGPRAPGNPLGGDGTGEGSGEGGNVEETVATPEEANLDYNRQAAELVLQRVRDDLNNNHVDPKLLEELGWTPDQLKRFTERLSKQLEKPAGELTPQDEARRLQFEEMLKSLDLKTVGAKRSGGNLPNREVDQSGTRRAPVPQDYKASWEAFTRNLSKAGRPAKKEPDASSKRR